MTWCWESTTINVDIVVLSQEAGTLSQQHQHCHWHLIKLRSRKRFLYRDSTEEMSAFFKFWRSPDIQRVCKVLESNILWMTPEPLRGSKSFSHPIDTWHGVRGLTKNSDLQVWGLCGGDSACHDVFKGLFTRWDNLGNCSALRLMALGFNATHSMYTHTFLRSPILM